MYPSLKQQDPKDMTKFPLAYVASDVSETNAIHLWLGRVGLTML